MVLRHRNKESSRQRKPVVYTITYHGMSEDLAHDDFMLLLQDYGVTYQFKRKTDTSAILEIYGADKTFELEVTNYEIGRGYH